MKTDTTFIQKKTDLLHQLVRCILAAKEWTQNLNTTILGLFSLNFAAVKIENQSKAMFTF